MPFVILVQETFNDVEDVIQSIETILRGKSQLVDIEQLLTKSGSIYQFFANAENCEKLGSEFAESKIKFLESAVKLHNKCRNLGNNYAEIRSNLKAACAWIFAALGEKSARVFVIVFKLLAKSGDDYYKLVGQGEHALQCYETALSLWSNVGKLDIADRLTPIDLQDMKIAVFACMIGEARIQFSYSKKIKEIKMIIAGAVEIVHFLTLSYRIRLCEVILEIITTAITDKESISEVLSLYTTCLDILEMRVPKSSLKKEDQGISEEALNIRKFELVMRCYLSLAFVHSESG